MVSDDRREKVFQSYFSPILTPDKEPAKVAPPGFNPTLVQF